MKLRALYPQGPAPWASATQPVTCKSCSKNLWNLQPQNRPKQPSKALELATQHLKNGCAWAQRSRLPSCLKLAKTLREHSSSILGYYHNRTTSAAIEAINELIQNARRRARSYRSFENR
jgi:transposase